MKLNDEFVKKAIISYVENFFEKKFGPGHVLVRNDMTVKVMGSEKEETERLARNVSGLIDELNGYKWGEIEREIPEAEYDHFADAAIFFFGEKEVPYPYQVELKNLTE